MILCCAFFLFSVSAKVSLFGMVRLAPPLGHGCFADFVLLSVYVLENYVLLQTKQTLPSLPGPAGPSTMIVLKGVE